MHTLANPLNRARRIARNDWALACGDDRLSYEEIWLRCRRLVGSLHAEGLRPGDRVAILMRNCHRYVEAYMALPSGGLVIVPLNTRCSEAELTYILNESGARVLITDGDPRGLSGLVERVVRVPDKYEELIAQGAEADLGFGVHENDLAGLFYTGGTAGAAKGVMLSHRNLIATCFSMLVCTQVKPDERWLISAPMFHAAGTLGLLATVWVAGRQVVLPAFDPAAVLDTIESERITTVLGVPTMWAAIVNEQRAQPRDTSSVRLAIHGGAPIATETMRSIHECVPSAEMLQIYGATELVPVTAFTREQRFLNDTVARSCGQPVVGIEMQVIGPEGQELDPGAVGEVAARGPNMMQGYWKKDSETASALVDGWFRSGDLGFVDGDGYLHLVDRKKDMIVSGGENVYSTEVEEALYKHPLVMEAAVFGTPDDKWGEAVHAVVVPRGPINVEDLMEHCRRLVAGYKLPKRIELRDEPLPKSGAGKILKRKLREPFWADRDVRVEGV